VHTALANVSNSLHDPFPATSKKTTTPESKKPDTVATTKASESTSGSKDSDDEVGDEPSHKSTSESPKKRKPDTTRSVSDEHKHTDKKAGTGKSR
jgi:hypothetical protein